MAAATAKKNTSLAKNPAGRMTFGKGNTSGQKKAGQSTGARKTPAKRNPAANPATKKKTYKRNPANAGVMSLVTTGIGAAFVALLINLFDFGANRLAPDTGAGIRIGVKAVIGSGLLMFGNKLPFGRSYAPMVGGGFVLASALDGIGTFVMPRILAWIDPANAPLTVVKSKPATNPDTGEMGAIHELSDGTQMQVWTKPAFQYTDNFQPSGVRIG